MRYINIEFPKFTFLLHFLSYFFFTINSRYIQLLRICGKKSYRDMSLDKFTIDMLPLTRQNILADGGDYFANITFKLNRFFTCFHGRLYADKFLEFLQVSCDPSIRSNFSFFFTTTRISYSFTFVCQYASRSSTNIHSHVSINRITKLIQFPELNIQRVNRKFKTYLKLKISQKYVE